MRPNFFFLKALKCLIVFSLLLMVTHLLVADFSREGNFWNPQSGSSFQSSVDKTLANFNSKSAIVAGIYNNSEVLTPSHDNVLLEYEEDEENEVHHFSKEANLQSFLTQKYLLACNYADFFRAKQGALQIEKISHEKVYILYQVIRI